MPKIPTHVRCLDGPLQGLRVYREGADWKARDLIQVVRYKDPPWARDGEGQWVQVFLVYLYQLTERGAAGADDHEWALVFVKDLN